jgi:hypothetical protein
MSKEDKIWVYTIGCRDNERKWVGILDVTHTRYDITCSIDNLTSHWNMWSNMNEFFVSREEVEIGQYLRENQFNLSINAAVELAKEHGFTLEDIGYTEDNYGMY